LAGGSYVREWVELRKINAGKIVYFHAARAHMPQIEYIRSIFDRIYSISMGGFAEFTAKLIQ
jgi:hypothetical protein